MNPQLVYTFKHHLIEVGKLTPVQLLEQMDALGAEGAIPAWAGKVAGGEEVLIMRTVTGAFMLQATGGILAVPPGTKLPAPAGNGH